ncbi:MAG TPA: hypothetical protein VFE78_34055 [Gemmataceae bacterium]|nr:hypothetical protein [Gemmataceae bacterium]
MAGRTRNRRELREQADQAERLAEAGAPAAGAKKAKAKSPAAPRVKKPRKPKAPPRLRARWGVFDGGMHQVATFDYNQRAAAQAKLEDLLARKKGLHFLQIVKEQMPEPAPAAAAAAD